jgi:hypothetical protein
MLTSSKAPVCGTGSADRAPERVAMDEHGKTALETVFHWPERRRFL